MLKRVFLSLIFLSMSQPTWVCAAGYDLDRLGVPRFVNTNYIDLSRIFQLSKFRSSAGHDYSDDLERCRSMKHYFIKPDSTTAIWSPVAGTIATLRDDFVGTQVHIRSDVQPDFTFVIFHVALARPLVLGEQVAEGQRLGNHYGLETFSDIAVAVNASNGYRLVSYFETLTDAAFAPFKARGIESAGRLMFTRAERDAAPYSCQGQTFSNLSVSPESEYVNLSGATPPTVSSMVSGPITGQTLSLFVSPPANILGFTGSVFLAAVLPSSLGSGIYLMSTSAAWTMFRGCDSAPAAQQGQLYAGMALYPVVTPADLSALKETSLFVGYGIGPTYASACAHMIDNRTITPAYTIN